MRIYIAAPYELRNQAIDVMKRLEAKGHVVTSEWLKDVDEEGNETAVMDLINIIEADVFLLINPAEFERSGTGGRHFETGYAYAKDKRVVILGVRSNIFHHLHNVTIWPSDVDIVEMLEMP